MHRLTHPLTILCALALSPAAASQAGSAVIDWTNQLPGADGVDAEGQAILLRKGKTFTAGSLVIPDPDAPGESTQVWAVRAVSSGKGETLWETTSDFTSDGDEVADVLAAAGPRLFAGGTVDFDDTGDTWVVRAHQAKTGEVLWERRISRSNDDELLGLSADRGNLIVSGTTNDGTSDWLVVSLDPVTGETLWETSSGLAGTDDDMARCAPGITKSTVSVVGSVFDDVTGFLDGVTRTYSLDDGSLLWEDVVAGNADRDDAILSVATRRNTVFVAGSSVIKLIGINGEVGSRGIVRALSAKDGSLRWNDSAGTLFATPQTTEDDIGEFNHVAVRGRNVIAAGRFENQVIDGTGTDPENTAIIQSFRAGSGERNWRSTFNIQPQRVLGAMDVSRRLVALSSHRVNDVGPTDLLTTDVYSTRTGKHVQTLNLFLIGNPNLTGEVGLGYSVATSGRRVQLIGHIDSPNGSTWLSQGRRAPAKP